MKFEHILKINNPTGRLEFFKYSIVILIMQTLFTFLFNFLTNNMHEFVSNLIYPFWTIIIFELLLLYLYFIQCAKRLWDITGSKKAGILANIVLFIISFIGMISFPLITVIIYLILILFQGKIVEDV